MKKRHLLLMALSLILSICMCFSLAACSSCDDDDDAPAKLSTPVVTIDNTGVASWLEVENASGYAYVIGDGAETATTKLSVTLTNGQTIKVKAKGDGTNYSDSDFSEVKTYTAPAPQPTKLGTPVVTIDATGLASWQPIDNALKYTTKINGVDSETSDLVRQLADGDTIQVKAVGNGTTFTDSDFSAVQTYDANAPQPSGVMTRAEFIAANDTAKVCVTGIVTAFSGKNVYFQDTDGGYYLYGSGKDDTTVIPANLAVGMTIKVSGTKAVYNGLNEITNATVEITNETPATITPVDVTDKIGNNDALLALQSTYVTVKGVTITTVTIDTEKNRTNVTLTVDSKTVLFYIGGTQVVASEQQTAISNSFKANEGKTADITALISLFSNSPQLIPANATPISNIQTSLEKLNAPSITIDANGVATVNDIDNRATKVVYVIGTGEETEYDADHKPTLTNGQSIKAKAVGDETTYDDSEWSATKTYSTVDPSTLEPLSSPVITVDENGNVSWTAVTGAHGYAYIVIGGEEKETSSTSFTPPLTAGQTVKVKALGDLVNNKNSEYAQATYVKKLAAPTIEIADDGTVTITADTNATKVVYVIGDGTEPVEYDENAKPILTKGQKITVTAKGNGTAYSDSDPVEKTFIGIMTHAEFVAAADGDEVAIKGIVTALRDTNVYIMDSDGGYYAFKATTVPANLSVGMQVKVTGIKTVYRSFETAKYALDEITEATIAIVNATPVELTAVDVTAKIGNETELETLQNTLTIVKGVTITNVSTNSKGNTTVTLTLNSKTIAFYVGGTQQVVTTEQQTAIVGEFTALKGKTVDVTGIITLSGNNLNIVPAGTTPISNVVLPKLATPTVEIDEDTGVATITDNDTHTTKLVYVIEGDTEKDYDAENKPVVPYGKKITVKAKGDGVDYADSTAAEATYDAQQIQLTKTPDFTIGATSGEVRITKEVAHATGYKYTVLAADGTTPVEGKIDLVYDANDKPVLENGQWIKFMSIGGARYEDSDYGEAKQYTYSSQLGKPTLSVDKDGNVSSSQTDGKGFIYTIKYLDEDTARAKVEFNEVVLSVKLEKSGTITVKAVKANDEQEDSEEATLTYKAPAKRATPTNVSFAKDTNSDNVIMSYTHVDGVIFSLTLDSNDPITVENGSVTIEIKAYTSMSFIALGTNPDEPITDGDYSGLFSDSDEFEDLLALYDNFYNDYKANIELNAITIVERIVAEQDIILPDKGTTYTDIIFEWSIVGGDTDYAILSDNTLVIDPASAPAEGTSVTIKAAVKDNQELYKEFTINVKLLQTSTDTFDLTKQVDVSNTITADLATVTFAKADANNAPVFNTSSKEVRLYAKGTMTITASNQLITKIEITYSQDKTDNTLSSDKETFTDNVWTGTATQVVFTVGGSSGHAKIKNVTVTYETPNFTDEEKVAKAFAALPEDFGYNVNGFTVSTEGMFDTTVSWSADNEAITFTDNGDGTATATVTRGDNDVAVTVKAKVSLNGVEQEKTYDAVTVVKKPDASAVPTAYEIIFSTQGYTNQQEASTITADACKIEFNKGSNSNATKYYTSGAALRAYGGNKIIITATSSYNIKKVTFTFGTSDGTNAITADVGTFTSPSWSGDNNQVTFTIGGATGHRRIAGIKVEFE